MAGSDELPGLEQGARRIAMLVGLGFGALLHALVGYFVVLSGLVMTGWAWLLLLLLWFAAALGMWSWRRMPMLVLTIPFGMAGALWVVWGVACPHIGCGP